jgi:hypothetical protein
METFWICFKRSLVFFEFSALNKRAYPKITVSLKFLLFYPNPKGDKRNFKSVSVQKWDTPE